jgi:hypothetical protein
VESGLRWRVSRWLRWRATGRIFWKTQSAQAQDIFLAELFVKVGAVSRCHVWPIVGVWPRQSVVVSSAVVFHADIGAFVIGFDRFSAN